MMLLIKYCPEMNVYTIAAETGQPRIFTPQDFATGAAHEKLSPVFHAAREAVESGSAVSGIHVTV